jgi:hypothetical protein
MSGQGGADWDPCRPPPPLQALAPSATNSCMTPVAHILLIVFIGAWCTAVAGWLYGTRFFLPIWAKGFRKSADNQGYGRKALIGYGVFVGAALFGFAVGGLAELAGGWE